ncbi:hypothetical protein BH23ACT9_BH23ACT9_25550 [soil metagenome]
MAAAEAGANAAALEELLSETGEDQLDPTMVQAARSLAALVDANPTSPGLWARYESSLDRLRSAVSASETPEIEQLLRNLRGDDWSPHPA